MIRELADLHVDHPLRTSPLIDVKARYRHRGKKKSYPVKPSWRIAKYCYNDLGQAWTAFTDWSAEE